MERRFIWACWKGNRLKRWSKPGQRLPANLKADMQSNILHWLWIHNAGVIGIAAAFSKYKTIADYLSDKPLVKQSLRATRERYALCARRGVNLKQFPEVSYQPHNRQLSAGLALR